MGEIDGKARRSRSMYCQTSISVQLAIGKTRMFSPLRLRALYRSQSLGRWFFGSHWPNSFGNRQQTAAAANDRPAVNEIDLRLAYLYPKQYFQPMKLLRFLGDSLKCLREFPEDARHDAGYQLDKVQRGEQPNDFKPMASIGRGVEEIRVWDDTGTYRVIYTARLADAVYVLHAFQKKTQTAAKRDVELARRRFTELMRDVQ